MSEILTNFEQLVVLYAPTVLLYITQFVDWFVTLKKFKTLDVQKQVAPVLNKVNSVAEQIETLEKDIRVFAEEKYNLSAQVDFLKANVKAQNEQMKELREYLKALSQENVELKAELRRKVECAVTEPKLA